MNSGKHQRSKQRCQDLGWKVHDRALSDLLLTNTFLLVSHSQYGINNYCVLCTVEAKGRTKT